MMLSRPDAGARRGVLAAIAIAAAAMLGLAGAKAQTAAAPVKIRVAGSDAVNSATPFFVAVRQGLFKQAGLDVTYVTVAGGAAPMAAAIKAGEVDIALGGAGEYMTEIAQGVIQGKIVGESTDNNYVIVGGNGITDIRQLKGKVFGISSHNGGDHLYSQAVLLHYGIKPDEVTWLPLGLPASRLAALLSGKIDGTEMVLTSMPDSAKSRIIISADDSPVPFVSNAIFARAGFIASNRPALQKFLATVGKGAEWTRAHPAEAVPACQDSGASEATCKIAIEVGTKSKNPYTWSSTSRVNTEAIKAMIPIVGAVVAEAKKLTVSDFVDTSIAGTGP
jgi:ABC-type nitrate/sulfonate/bicarbonate transport system substrate-binding protein